MKLMITLLSCLICVQLLACGNKEIASSLNNVPNTDSMKLKITIGKKVFTATLYNNAAATSLKARLPMTVDMQELNDNEKYFDLPYNLPTSASNPGTVHTGDLMLYGSNTLVLFYKSFSTSYSYTRLAQIDDPSGLAAALGSGNIAVEFELKEK